MFNPERLVPLLSVIAGLIALDLYLAAYLWWTRRRDRNASSTHMLQNRGSGDHDA